MKAVCTIRGGAWTVIMAATALLLAAQSDSTKQQVHVHGPESSPFYQQMGSPWKLFSAGKWKDAEAGFRAVAEKAAQAGDLQAQAWCHNALGQVFYRQAQYPAARSEYEQALQFYERIDDPLGLASTEDGLGSTMYSLGKAELARKYYGEALSIYRKYALLREIAFALGHLSLLGGPNLEEIDGEELAIARQIGDKGLEAEALHHIGDQMFVQSQFDVAQQHYEQAAKLFEEIGDKHGLAYLLTSEGRLHRAHGQPGKSLELYRAAIKLQHEINDRFGEIQSTNAIAVAYQGMGRKDDAVLYYRRALAMAKDTGSERVIDFELGNLAGVLVQVGQNREAAAILERQVQVDTIYGAERYNNLSIAYFNLRRYRQAKDAADRGMELDRNGSDPFLAVNKALAERKLGEPKAALTDALTAVQKIETGSSHLVADDSMKRGYFESTQHIFSLAITLLSEARQYGRALEIAEEARSRAFLDLLATRNLQGRRGKEIAALAKVKDQLAEVPASVDPGPTTASDEHSKTPDSALWGQWMRADPEVRSLVSVQPGSLSQYQDSARRLHSTVLTYWVSDDATDIWVVGAGGSIGFARVPVSAAALRRRIGALWHGAAPVAIRGPSTVLRSGETPVGSVPGESPGSRPWRDLYNLLIRPVEKWLPPRPGSLVTIEPHGPLLVLPFAALQNEQGQYLIERFTLHSIPAVSLLQFTEKKKLQTPPDSLRYLLIADPSHLPAGPDGKRWPELPGTRLEVSSIMRMLPRSQVKLLEGDQAREKLVQESATDSTVIHFATHGVILDDHPLDSFLALSGEPSGNPSSGRLTVQKIYGLDLHADLVFLSSCRSGMGAVSGDGIDGLTRAFLYAGTPSVIATLWDVADETAHRLVTGFYSYWLKGNDKATALRLSQLKLLHDLRAGEVKIEAKIGEVVLPEDPVFWASFVLQGEP